MAIKRGFMGNFYLSSSGGTKYSESRSPYSEEKRGPTAQTLVDSLVSHQRSLGTVPKKSWDSAVWGQSWDSAVLGQSWTRAVLVQSWDSTALGQYGLGTVVLGH